MEARPLPLARLTVALKPVAVENRPQVLIDVLLAAQERRSQAPLPMGAEFAKRRVSAPVVRGGTRFDPVTDIVASVGSGDAFLAGFVAAWLANPSPEQAVRRAVACGAANPLQLGAGVFDPDDVDAFARRVEIAEIN